MSPERPGYRHAAEMGWRPGDLPDCSTCLLGAEHCACGALLCRGGGVVHEHAMFAASTRPGRTLADESSVLQTSDHACSRWHLDRMRMGAVVRS